MLNDQIIQGKVFAFSYDKLLGPFRRELYRIVVIFPASRPVFFDAVIHCLLFFEEAKLVNLSF